jgi:hypothetical protein
MICYRPAGQDFYFSHPLPELEPFEIPIAKEAEDISWAVPPALTLSCSTVGWVGGEQRQVESWSAPPGTLLKVAGAGDFYIAPGGRAIVRVDETQEMTGLDREILLGPALVLALALRGTWCLHASAVILKDRLTVFLGESGQGKSTLAAYLSGSGGGKARLVADDILPVTASSVRVDAWPHFPQLKLSLLAQPGPALPERLSLEQVCILTDADSPQMPALKLLAPGQAARTLVSHTAGARLFDPPLLAGHLAFCAEVAGQVPVYRLVAPHRRDALPKVADLLENVC